MGFSFDIDHSLETLLAGGTILYPTDTIWGLGCDATNVEAVSRIYQIKKREESKALIVMVTDEKEILKYVAIPDLQVFEYLKTVQKPTTVIYEGAIGLADNLIAKDGTVAMRMVNDEFCRHLIKRFRKPIVSTSANISGEPAPRIFEEIPEEIRRSVDYIVHHRQDDKTVSEPSAVVKWEKNKMYVIRP